MIRFYTLFMLLAGFSRVSPAQTLLPFLGTNGKYGFADESGKIIFVPEFEGNMEAFGPDDLYKDLQKNGEGIRLFRSGMVVPNPRLVLGHPRRCVDIDSRTGRADTLTDLIFCQLNNRFLFIDLKMGKTVEIFNESYLNKHF